MQSRRGWPTLTVAALLLAGAALGAWVWWAEDHPRAERALRVLVHERLLEWFPAQMTPEDGWHGLHQRTAPAAPAGLRVVLVHGLDEPGSIWDDLVPALGEAGFETWEFRYPNDQAIDRSADYLARHWPSLPDAPAAALVGHSMGGLVARDFVSRWRHPVGSTPKVGGAPIAGVILAGTPNHGSEWARLRIWLELRDQFPSALERRHSAFAALRDGTGAAKIDLRPGSDFLRALNARPWPRTVPIRLIGGRLIETPEDLAEGLDALAAELDSEALQERLHDWWSTLEDGLGDGVVTLESLRLAGAAPPELVNASHRGMLHRLFPDDPQPPAIPLILETLRAWETPRH